MKKTILFFLGFVFSISSLYAAPQSPNATGRWVIELNLSNSRPHKIQLEFQGNGNATYLLLDNISSLNPPPVALKATWNTATDGRTEVSGSIEFPIGNVGIEAGTLTLTGTFSDANTFTGSANFTNDAIKQTKSGNFTARRITETVAVELLTANDGEVLRRGSEVEITWEIKTTGRILSQQLFLSVDKGRTYTAISEPLDGSRRSYIWQIPADMPKAKKAKLKVLVIDENGIIEGDVTDRVFRIK